MREDTRGRLDIEQRKTLGDSTLPSPSAIVKLRLAGEGICERRSLASDDVLFCEEKTDQYYFVHLTWTRNNNDQYPKFLPFSTMSEFIEHCRETFLFDDD